MLQAVAEYEIKLGLSSYFKEAQVNRNCHPRLISSLTKLCKKANIEAFTLEFVKLVGAALIQNEKSQHAIKLFEFIAKFCCHLDDSYGETFLSKVIKFIVQVSDRKEPVVRQRACDVVSLLFTYMGPQAAISDDLFEMVTNAMLERMQDKLPTVRSKAVVALQRFQEPQEDSCLVIKTYLYHLEFDPIPDVRKKVIENIAISSKTLPSVIGRSRDVSEIVRKAMYKATSKLKFSRFRISHRQTLISDGLNDKSETVRDFIKKQLIAKWFELCSRDFLIFLEHLDVQTFQPKVLEALLISQFSMQAASELIELVSNLLTPDKLIPIEKLKPESAALWLYVVKYFVNPPEGIVIQREMVESILPTLTSLAMFVKIISKGVTRTDTSLEFILSCLIQLSAFIEADTAGTTTMIKTCRDILLNPEVDSQLLIMSISQLLRHLIQDSSERVSFIVETSSDILFPLEETSTEYDISKLDGDVLLKVMVLADESLKASDIEMNPALFSFANNVVFPSFTHSDRRVLAKAVTVLSHACMLDVNLAKANFIKFQILIDLEEVTSAAALEAFFNLLLIHGMSPFFPEEEDEEIGLEAENKFSLDLSNEPLLTVKMRKAFGRVLAKLESMDLEIRSVAAHGLAKLMLSGQLRSPQVLARLIILWFNPDLGQDPKISQPLGLFFNVFAKKVTSAGDIILGTLIPLIKHVAEASADSSSYLIDLTSVCHFVMTLLRPNLIPLSVPSHQYLLAISLTDYLLSRRCSSNSIQSVAKSFSHIEMQPSDEEYIHKLNENLDKLVRKLMKLEEKVARNCVLSFRNRIMSSASKSKVKNTSGLKVVNRRSRSCTPTDESTHQTRTILVNTIEEEDESIIENEETVEKENIVPLTPENDISQSSAFDVFESSFK